HKARVIDGLAPGVACLDSRTAVAYSARQRCLQRMIRRVRVVGDHVLHPKAADHVPRAIEPGVFGKFRGSSGISVGKAVARKVLSRGPYIRRIGSQIAEFSLQAKCPSKKAAV